MSFHRARSTILIGTAALILSGCPADYAVWLVEPATARELAFGLATKRHGREQRPLNRITVETCQRITPDLRRTTPQVAWLAQVAPAAGWNNGPALGRVTYGVSPAGFRDSIGPEPLRPGCYAVLVYAYPGTAAMRLWVDSGGRVREWSEADADSAGRAWDAYAEAQAAADSAAIQTCRRAYRDAKTLAESTAVAARVPYDTARFEAVSCAALRRVGPDAF